MRRFLCIFFLCFGVLNVQAEEKEARVLPLEEYIQLATQNDTEFQAILINELLLQYQKDLNLPAGDLVLDATARYDLFLGQNREEQEGSVSLSKLFPMSGTEVEAAYSTTPGFTRTTNRSDFSLTVTQPIAENAFGKATRLLDQIIGVEIDVARHQIVEAYEDYLARVIIAYFDWLEAYENLQIGESSYRENLKLMKNIKERQKSSIALPIDVNKISLQVWAKKETLIDIQKKYQNALNFIEQTVRHEGQSNLVPESTQKYSSMRLGFEEAFQEFKEESRTYTILSLLEDKSSLEVDKDANELLPSIELLLGYKVDGQDLEITDEENLFFAGISMEWPIGNQVDQAEYETSVINKRKTELNVENTHYQLYTNIKDLTQQIDREQQLFDIALKKIDLSRSVVKDETENYSYGKVTINDYIQAVNSLDNNRFSRVRHQALKAKLIVERLRLTDRLISRNDIK